MYAPGEYDLAGFIVGAAERKRICSPAARSARAMCCWGCLRRVCTPTATRWRASCCSRWPGYRPNTLLPELGATVADELLKVHRSYLKPMRALMAAGLLKGAAHITGGGITDNTPRMLPTGWRRAIDLGYLAGAADLRSCCARSATFRKTTGGAPSIWGSA